MMIADTNSIDDVSSVSVSTDMSTMIFKAWQDQYQLIHHLILYSNILMVVQGRKQSGKTTYIKGLIAKLPSNFSCHIISANQIQSKEALDLSIRQLFSLNSLSGQEDKNQPSLMSQIQQNQKHCLLVIDDAHLLCEQVLSTILNYLQNQETETYFHCLMIGDPLLSARFSESTFASCRESMTHFIDMPDLDLQDAKLLLARKYSSLGKAQISSMNDDSIRYLLKTANGDLIKLCELAEQKLKGGEVLQAPNLIEKLQQHRYGKVIGTTMASVMCFMIVMSFRSPISSEHKIQQLALPGQSTGIMPLEHAQRNKKLSNEKSFELRPELSSTIELTDNSVQFNKKSLGFDEKSPESSKSSLELSKDNLPRKHKGYVPMSMIPNYKLLAKRGIKDTTQQVSNAQKSPGEAVSKYKGEKLTNKNVAVATPIAPKITLRFAKPSPVKADIKKSEPEIAQIKKAVRVKRYKAAATHAKAVRQSTVNKLTKNVGKGYGIQLAASSNISALKQFAKANHVHAQARYYTATRKGKRWYMLVLGDYGTKAQASSAKKTLPMALKNKKPWLRSIKGLKEVR